MSAMTVRSEECPPTNEEPADRWEQPWGAGPRSAPYNDWAGYLVAAHTARLLASGVAEEVAKERGYVTAMLRADIVQRGFSKVQWQGNGLLIPLYDTAGDLTSWQYRPDKPKVDASGKSAKYLSPPRKPPVLDVHPFVRDLVGDPTVPMLLTEGVIKADAAVSAGACCLSISGVNNWRGRNTQGGVTALAAFADLALNGRTVYLAFDSDACENKMVRSALAILKAYLDHKGATVLVVHLPPSAAGKTGLDDYLSAGHSMDDVLALADHKLPDPIEPDLPDEDDLPSILLSNRPLRAVAEASLTALALSNRPPRIFNRRGRLVRYLIADNGSPILQTIQEAELRAELTRSANFYRRIPGGFTHSAPPRDVIQDLLARGKWGESFPRLEAMTEVPVVRPDGSILDSEGYDPQTGLIYAPSPGLEIPLVPSQPSKRDVSDAVDYINDAFGDIPYLDSTARANMMALLMTPQVRHAIDGLVPLAVIDAPQAGTGKSLLADGIAMVNTGRSASMMSAPDNEEEWRKKVTSKLMTGPAVVTIDNVVGMLDSTTLAIVTTATVWEDRVLGRNEMIELPNRATWMLTGNQVRLGGDLPRRCYRIRIDARTSQPWRRTGFRHPKLMEWLSDNRGRMIVAILTLIRAWHVAGRPLDPSVKALGGFNAWAETIGGILSHAGIDGFLGDLDRMYAEGDGEPTQWEGFLIALNEQFPDRTFTTQDFLTRMDGRFESSLPDDLHRAWHGPAAAGFSRTLGKALSAHASIRYGDADLYLLRDGASHNQARWRVEVGRPESLKNEPRSDVLAAMGSRPIGVTHGVRSDI